ncbi:hypothetical protein LZ30DRAFT_783515 [Colletotrichum cereale]|nr:hypothetical protein LZ30DRAFT_783515 [Colletotrichum cereale]
MGSPELDRVPETSPSSFSASTTDTPVDGAITDGQRIKDEQPAFAVALNSAGAPPPAISYPEGGTTAWLVVLGSWLALFSSMCLINSIGAFQAHIQRNQLAGHTPAAGLLTAFAVVFGFFSGGNVSLAPVCIGQLCTIESYGRYYAAANVLVSINTLTGIPIAGALFERSQGSFRNLIIVTIVSYSASFVCLVIAKLLCYGRRGGL